MLQQPTSVLQSFTEDVHSELPRKDPVFKQNTSCLSVRTQGLKPSKHGGLTALCRHEGRRKQDTSGIYFKNLSCIWMATDAKSNHASGRGTEAEQAKYRVQVKGRELEMTSRKGNSTDQRVFNVLHMLQPFKKHIMTPETF